VRKFRLIAACVVAVAIIALLVAWRSAVQRRVLITISEATTRITGPLSEDGSVDYIAAINQETSRGVTPENNAVVLLRQALGTANLEAAFRDGRYFPMLGIDPPPEEGDYFIPFEKFAAPSQDTEEYSEYRDPFAAPVEDPFDAAMARPWVARQYPVVARWLKANNRPLELTVEASLRQRYYSPLISPADPPLLMAVLYPYLFEFREMVKALVARAMWRVGRGEIDAARADLMACHRLARLADQGSTAVNTLAAGNIEETVCRAEAALAHFGNLTDDQARRMQADLAALPPLSPIAARIDISERYVFLDTVGVMARLGISTLMDDGLSEDHPLWEYGQKMGADAMVDWNFVLRMGNSYYDRMVEAMNRPTYSERVAAIAAIEEENAETVRQARDAEESMATFFPGQSPRKSASQLVGGLLLGMTADPLSDVKSAEARTATHQQLARVAIALAAYRAEFCGYPEQLAELDPNYITPLPVDLFTQGELRYRRQSDGYILYSVGPDGIDDDGRDRDFYDDIAIHSFNAQPEAPAFTVWPAPSAGR